MTPKSETLEELRVRLDGLHQAAYGGLYNNIGQQYSAEADFKDEMSDAWPRLRDAIRQREQLIAAARKVAGLSLHPDEPASAWEALDELGNMLARLDKWEPEK